MKKGIEKELTGVMKATLNGVEQVVDGTERTLDKVTKPIRENVLKRFPTLFLLLVTFGFTAIVTSMEQFLVQFDAAVVFWLGIVILVITGRLYKRLS